MPATDRSRVRHIVRVLAVPVIWAGLIVVALWEPLQAWLAGEDRYDKAALREWLQETNIAKDALPAMLRAYSEMLAGPVSYLESGGDMDGFRTRLANDELQHSRMREEIFI